MTNNEIKDALNDFYRNILRALKKEFGDLCKVEARNVNKSIFPEKKAHCEVDLVRWEEIEDADQNDLNTRLLCHWEIRILDRNRMGKDGEKKPEHRNLSVHVRSLAMTAHMLIRKNDWSLEFAGMPRDIVCEDDNLGEKLNEEEQWLISFSQEIAIGEEETCFDPRIYDDAGERSGTKLAINRRDREEVVRD